MFGGGDKCGRCAKTVYANEKRLGAGQSWHKMCFRCPDCNKMLDSTTLATQEKEIFCKACHGKRFGPKGYGFGGGAGTLSMDGGSRSGGGVHVVNSTAATAASTPPAAAAAPAAAASGGSSGGGNKFCGECGAPRTGNKFCGECGAAAAPAAAAPAAAAAAPAPSRVPAAFKTGNPTMKFGGSEKCPRCAKSVYANEKRIGAGQSWHKMCFTCKTCNKLLDSTTLRDSDGEIFCDSCHGKQFGPKGTRSHC